MRLGRACRAQLRPITTASSASHPTRTFAGESITSSIPDQHVDGLRNIWGVITSAGDRRRSHFQRCARGSFRRGTEASRSRDRRSKPDLALTSDVCWCRTDQRVRNRSRSSDRRISSSNSPGADSPFGRAASPRSTMLAISLPARQGSTRSLTVEWSASACVLGLIDSRNRFPGYGAIEHSTMRRSSTQWCPHRC